MMTQSEVVGEVGRAYSMEHQLKNWKQVSLFYFLYFFKYLLLLSAEEFVCAFIATGRGEINILQI